MHSYALFLLASIATLASAACDRDDLKDLAIQYVDAQATGSVEDMPPFIDVATVSLSEKTSHSHVLCTSQPFVLGGVLGRSIHLDIVKALPKH